MNIFAAIDLETTGLAPGWNDVLEIAVVPLTPDFTIDRCIPEFSCRVRAEHPDRIDPKAVAVNHLNPAEGKPLQDVEADLIHWAEENGINTITPIAHNLAFDMAFMKAAFPVFSRIITHHGRDSMRLALSLNDILRTQIGEEPFPQRLAPLAQARARHRRRRPAQRIGRRAGHRARLSETDDPASGRMRYTDQKLIDF